MADKFPETISGWESRSVYGNHHLLSYFQLPVWNAFMFQLSEIMLQPRSSQSKRFWELYIQ